MGPEPLIAPIEIFGITFAVDPQLKVGLPGNEDTPA